MLSGVLGGELVLTSNGEVPEHKVGDDHLVVERSSWIRQFHMRKPVDTSLYMDG